MEKIRNHPFFVEGNRALEEAVSLGNQMTNEEAAAQFERNLLPNSSESTLGTSARTYKSE